MPRDAGRSDQDHHGQWAHAPGVDPLHEPARVRWSGRVACVGFYRDQVLPRLIDKVLDNDDIGAWRERCVQGLHGVVVEPGFGSGLNIGFYPDEVTKVYAVDPAQVGQKLAAERLAETHVEVEFVGLDGADLPLDDASCDAALLTLTLCTIRDVEQALRELRRVLKSGGRLHFFEHGHAPDARVAAWQARVEPVQKWAFDGCHLTRDMTRLITDAGFEIDWVEQAYGKGPKPWSFYYLGQAVSP